ncbi:MAG: glycosyltransferase family 1 protein [Rhodospirillales bacterium]|nr:glycosyltransferase family 1 protein [Rhodospirillales bacterium]MCB9965734.1 glycosyltransferase family 1 protein [Rhodospirillales bacterium]MCB9979662.1 glycosyltransferase family 1 protein [Rhodospirillales bacterium]
MKILIISDAWHPQVNGVVRTYEHLVEELEAMGHTTLVIGPEDFPWRTGLPGYEEIRLVLFPYRHLKRMIDGFAPDIIHIAVEGPLGWAARRYCRVHQKEFSSAYHTHFPKYAEERIPHFLSFLRKPIRKLSRWYVRSFHKPAKVLLIASPSLEENLREWQFQNRILRLTRGINEKIFYPGEKVAFQDLKRPVALYVGRVSVEKNLEAFLKMAWDGTKVVVGNGPSKTYLQKKYPEAVFTGQKSGQALADLYRSADMFVFPSRTDTFGIVLLEALGCGLPVAAYPVIGPKDIISEDCLGCLDEDLSKAARVALERGDPAKCVAYVRKNFSWKTAAQQFLDAFEAPEAP